MLIHGFEHLTQILLVFRQIVDEDSRVSLGALVHIFEVILIEFIAVVLVDDVHRVLIGLFRNVPLRRFILQHVVRIGSVIRVVVISLIIVLCLLTSLGLDCRSLFHNLLLFRIDCCLFVGSVHLSFGYFLSLAHEVLLFELLFCLRVLHLEQLMMHIFDATLCPFVIVEKLAVIFHISLS